tara:strand:+ start:298 stop:750 length:453 start_codon:yes stop_codon:yes gene_type:complete
MKLLTCTFFPLLLLGFAGGSYGQSAAEDEAIYVFQRFLSSFTNLDVDSIVDLFSKDAIFWGTGSKILVEDTAGIREYFSAIGGRPLGQRVASALEYSALVLSEGSVLVSGMWQVVSEGQVSGTPLRLSMALALRNGEWKIVQFHNSRVPD